MGWLPFVALACNDLALVIHLLAKAPPDLAGGRVGSPPWLILVVAFAVAALAVGTLVMRFRRAPKDKR